MIAEKLPLVSICMITYNHEKYISRALESLIIQNTDFAFEIVIGEDLSSDGTRLVCESYAKDYPGLIRLLPSEKNLGIQKNFCRTLSRCRGHYIAICEGDDYWTDARKLQKQVDFLINNPAYSSCAHQSNVIYENHQEDPHLFNTITNPQDFYINDLLEMRKFHTASFVFRSEIIQSGQKLPENITSTDRALFLLCSCHGPIRFQPDSMCVYRKNHGGISSWININLLKKDLNIIPWIKKINPKFPGNKFKSYIYYTMFTYPLSVKRQELIKYYFLFALYSFSYFPHNIKRVLRAFRNDVWAKL